MHPIEKFKKAQTCGCVLKDNTQQCGLSLEIRRAVPPLVVGVSIYRASNSLAARRAFNDVTSAIVKKLL